MSRRRPDPRGAEMEDAPPFFTWRAIYLIVIGALVVEIVVGAIVTAAYSMSALDWLVLIGTLGADHRLRPVARAREAAPPPTTCTAATATAGRRSACR